MHQKRCLLFRCAERNPVANIRARAACLSVVHVSENADEIEQERAVRENDDV